MSRAAMFDNLKPLLSFLKKEMDWEELTPHQQKMWKLINEMHGLIMQYHSRNEVIEIFKGLHPEISQTSTYRYYDRAQYLIGSTHFVDRNYGDLHLEEIMKRGIKMALDKEDLRSLGKFIKELREHQKEQASRKNNEVLFTPHTYVITMDPRQIGIQPEPIDKIEKMIKGFELDESLTEQLIKSAQTVPYTDAQDDRDSDT